MKRLLFLLLLFVVGASQAQTTWMVDSLNDSGFGSLRAAADSCSSGDTIRFNPNLIANGSDSVVLTSGEIAFDTVGVVIKGLYNSGDTLFISGNQISRIFSFSGAGMVILDSVAIVNGNSSGIGGGVFFENMNDTVWVFNSFFSKNSGFHGGGVGFNSSSLGVAKNILIVDGCRLIKNFTNGSGGGIYSKAHSQFSISQIFVDNSYISNNDGLGVLSSAYYTGRTSNSSIVTVTNSVISNNDGGGILSNVYSLSSGTSPYVHESISSVNVSYSTISGNVGSQGAGIRSSASTYYSSSTSSTKALISIDHSTMTQNSGGHGGAISCTSYCNYSSTTSPTLSKVDILNSTITDNTASSGWGGNIYAYAAPTSQPSMNCVLNISGSILTDNDSTVADIYNSHTPTIVSSGYNIFGDSIGGMSTLDSFNVNSSQLNLLPLAYYGGDTPTLVPGTNSIALDNGNPTDSADAQNGPIVGVRNVGAAENCIGLPSAITISQCTPYSVPSGNTIYYESGLYYDTLQTSCGADSVIAIDLSINSDIRMDSVVACNNYTWINGTTYYASADTVILRYINTHGCDSSIGLNLVIYDTSSSFVSITVCDSMVSPSGRYIWKTSNTYVDTILNVMGCDSIITVDLTVNSSSFSVLTETVCYNYVSPSGRFNWKTSGVYKDTLLNSVGCDSIITVNLTVILPYRTDVLHACDSLTWVNGVTYYNSNNTATDTLVNALGCDSIVFLNLTIYPSYDVVDTVNACDSLVWLDGNTYYSDNYVATFLGNTTQGCDSLVSLHLNVTSSVQTTDSVQACLFYQWSNGQYYFSDNHTATQVFAGSNGCDSILNLDLKIHHGTWGIDTQMVCDSLVWIDGNTYYTNNNTAVYNMVGGNSNGCDSVVTLNLTVNGAQSTDVITACDSLTWINGVTYYSSSNNAKDTLVNAFGCDSVVSLDLTIVNSSNNIDVITACDSLTWIDGVTYYSSNTAEMTFVNSVGCDSVVHLDLTISNSTTYVDEITSCTPLTWLDGVTYSQSITGPSYTLINALGCDSVVTLDFTLNQVDTSVVKNNYTLTANASNATFQWINCESGVISGATQSSYTVTANGTYQVEVTQNGCVDTSDCYTVNNVGIGEVNLSNNINIYPNPVHDQVNIEITNWPTNGVAIMVRDITGKQVYTEEIEPISNKETVEINTTKWAKGTYFIEVGEGQNRAVEQIVVQ